MRRNDFSAPPPSRAVSIAVSATLVIVWGVIRLVMFDTVIFPLTYAIPLLVCVWTRDRIALWSMATAFLWLHVIKLFWILPSGALTPAETTANLVATLANILIGAIAVEAIIRLRSRLEQTLGEVQAQADQLRAQGEELAQQNEELTEQSEELSQQTEELSQQGEELASQNEELGSLASEVGTLNAVLQRREHLLETLLDTARLSGGEQAALRHIANAALELFGETGGAVAVYERTAQGIRLQAVAPDSSARHLSPGAPVEDHFAALVLHEDRTAALNDTSLRPDLTIPPFFAQAPVRAVLCAPIRFGAAATGAFAFYSARDRDWTSEEFRLAEWLADQCGRAFQALRVQLDLREADQRKNEFLATLSHELRNPLAPIRFALNLIEQGQGENGNAVRIMQRQFQQLVRLVDDLLDATRLSNNKIHLRKTSVDLTSAVHLAVEACRPDVEAAGHALTVTFPTEPVWLEADPDRIGQVVTNLLNNATRYTPPAGQLGVTVTVTEQDAALSVTDSGVGMHPDDLGRVFDMFMQVGGPGSGGLGIGLALVRGIVELHGGQVAAFSRGPGLGSEFRVTLPLATSAIQGDGTVELAPARAANPRRVLVVDDNIDAAVMMGALLEMHGHTVWIAHDAETALETANRVAPDVALLDIGLPEINGYQLARSLRQGEATRHLRLVAVTGWGQDGDRARAIAAGFNAHFTKPAEPDLILAIVREESDATTEA